MQSNHNSLGDVSCIHGKVREEHRAALKRFGRRRVLSKISHLPSPVRLQSSYCG